MLCPQAWPISGRESYSAQMPMCSGMRVNPVAQGENVLLNGFELFLRA